MTVRRPLITSLLLRILREVAIEATMPNVGAWRQEESRDEF
ncbi:hypothetical protein AS9A_0969 [Hoyosella subflava DQS3-9A1]|uniref:Uncharacterized protein n=1 Tax=Hoyosella subflava (strain DSM 45089 / JCM 17490 / NBRC 109087 / DQS3-9A1) TaxID=443218 RepID=F6EPI8_HOYSD|nr:hypothetical protein AS9A_0969 [Hoyosella subflava DQS3-9A1]